ncbi:bifunctional glutamate N-acetyltransferase/amino-acid acetyltransferase ArgJ [Litoreibacter arenae]|uniref:Arginine biosynthesis bifunctional protein ArgJ n=1 Tax=Litoreibacter arenae DSM 19593 TaxID=1123360 RepID=S9RUQ9_9RHOB|nr:bifunctional glutamate N-acetyltransferase/amino-acid acetyltransferase ArgJ [Litoreibacter arenae]EPX77659.1 Glutamate N-acetyltransferase / N-acetylglutamate synthase [Litoreibacter arenae DSM 19593]
MAKITKVSPLAPKGGFPKLPVIDGVRFSTVAAGVKYAGRTDVMLAQVDAGSAVAGVFTRSSTRSAPVLDCQAKLGRVEDDAKGFAFLVNSGNSNAFTGRVGFEAVEAITKAAADTLNIPASHIYTCSTGVIGEPLPHGKITDALDQLSAGLEPDRIEDAARAIMTTDTFPKGSSATCEIGGIEVTVAGIAKGSGMIAPDMATMLVYIFTDAKISQAGLQDMVSRQNEGTFNAITVDSDTSTSDSVLVAATGTSGANVEENETFERTLGVVMKDLAHQVVRDGEGATKFVEVRVSGAADNADARKVGMSIANSPLVKTAIAGEDANWGRVVMAVGKSGAQADRDTLSIWFGDVLVAENGWVSPTYVEADAAAHMKGEDLLIRVDLGVGKGESTVWTCDLTHGYIDINADYRS